ncbi:Alcohol dehydrogenase [Acidisarcina polymorpha]|uniref:Alcohol dehydrogenase n=1 Tax=Acidisarcina polymorpha TaxID=2211140 RepID=A0A2Z5FZH5_9BACT|nr:Alcohol dehydrogenase [Acidisarcina polymorpha]
MIDAVYSFEDGRAAYDHLYRGAFGKIVIRVVKGLSVGAPTGVAFSMNVVMGWYKRSF